MAKSEIKSIAFKLEEVNVDPTQYKPFSHKLTSDNVYVIVDIPSEEWVETKEGRVFITLGGLSTILTRVAEAVDETAEEFRTNKMKGR